MSYDLINLMQLIFLIVIFTSAFSYAINSYIKYKHKTEKNITRNILIRWLEFIKKLLPQHYITYEKYGIWRFSGRFKIEMMF